MIAHKIELKANNQQITYFKKASGVARLAWNWGLSNWQEQYIKGLNPSGISLKKEDLDVFKNIPFPCRFVTSYSIFDEDESIGVNDYVRPYDKLNDEQRGFLKVKRDTINACLSTMLGNVSIPDNLPTLKKKRLKIPQNKIDYFLDMAYMGIRHSSQSTIEKVASDSYAILKELDSKNIHIRDSYMLFYKRLALLAYT